MIVEVPEEDADEKGGAEDGGMDVGGAVAVALLGGGTGLGAADAGGGVADFRRANKRVRN